MPATKKRGAERANAGPRWLPAHERTIPQAYRHRQRWLAVRSATVRELRRRRLVPDDADALERIPPAMTFAAQIGRVAALLEVVGALRRRFALTDGERGLVAALVFGACRRAEGGVR